MNNTLEIKYKNQKQFFEILDEEIIVDLNTTKHKLRYNIPLDDIKKTHFISKSKENGFTLLAYLSIFTNILIALYFLFDGLKMSMALSQSILLSMSLALIFILKTFFDGHDEKHIDSSKLFYFIYTKKNSEEVDKFITLIYQKQIEFFKKKYFVIDPVLPYNVQFERYLWLYSNQYINENEYEVIKEDLDKYFNFNINIQQ